MSTQKLSDAARARIVSLMSEYPDSRSALLPALYVAQGEYGWLPQEAVDQVAAILGLTPTEAGSVASFYSMFHVRIKGEHVIDFCTDLPCALVGAEQVYGRLREELDLKEGEETTADSLITLRPAMCLGGCHRAPVLLLDNEQQLEQMTEAKLDELIDKLRRARAGQSSQTPAST